LSGISLDCHIQHKCYAWYLVFRVTRSNKFINIDLIDPTTLEKNNKFIFSKIIKENIPELDVFACQNISIHIPTGTVWVDS
jgi:hypothetical protein